MFLSALVAGSVLFAPIQAADPAPLPRAQPSEVGLSAAKFDEATALLNQLVAERKLAGAVAGVARRGKLVYLAAVGAQTLEPRVGMTDRSLFRIYSMTKSVTAVAVMQFVEQGRVGLSDPVSRYLPEFAEVRVAQPDGTTRAPSKVITVEDLLLHTSGLNHRTSPEYHAAAVRARDIALPQFVKNIVRVPLMEDPGSRFRYSESSTVLGRLVEVWSGKPFDEHLGERILRPLKMTDTRFWVRSDQRARLTTVYSLGEGTGLQPVEIEAVPFTERPALLEGAVGLVATLGDYLRFAQMLLNGGAFDGERILRADTVARMVENGLSPTILAERGSKVGWGLANVNVVLDPAGVPYPASRGEYGWDGSAGTIFWVDPRAQLITLLMTQSVPADPDRVRRRFKTLVQQAVIE
jgi:CubicO group peptidase (beta-lactamase class C family)